LIVTLVKPERALEIEDLLEVPVASVKDQEISIKKELAKEGSGDKMVEEILIMIKTEDQIKVEE
jgi:hypothetical protein